MAFRVTPQTTTAFNVRNLNLQLSSLAKLQRQISSGIGVSRPSDDPVRLRESLILKDAQSRLEAHLKAVDESRTHLQQAFVALEDAKDIFVQAHQIAVEGRQPETTDLTALAAEVDSLMVRLERVANSADVAGVLFGGTALDGEPFPQSPYVGGTPSYSGAEESTRLILSDEAERGPKTLRPGSEVFDTSEREATIIEGTTGAAPGTGTDTATGAKSLTIEHISTTYSGGSGVQPGASSATGDTVIGANVLEIIDTSGTGASGTVSLNGGVPVAFTSGDTDLLVSGVQGESVYIDATNITAGFTGTVNLQGDGQASIDGGATFAPITFSANQTLVDSRNGTTVNVDTTAVKMVGTDRVEFPKTASAFEALRQLRDDLLASAGLPASERSELIGRRLDDVQRVQNHLIDEVGKQSVQLENLDKLQTLFEDKQLQVKTDLGEIVSTDVAAAVVEMQQAQSLLQYTYATAAQLYSTSLLNFLQ